jgi:hypothetical protein
MLASLLGACLLLASPSPQGRLEQAILDFKLERERVLVQCGQRHLDYGLELRKKGLTLQAATQLTQAVEASRGLNDNARYVLGLMQQYDDAFWKRKGARPGAARLETYAKKAARLRQDDQVDQLGLVRWAERKNLDEQAFDELSELLLALDEPLVFEAGEKGALVLPGGKLSGPLAERVRAEVIQINGRPYVRDAFLRRVPELREVFETSSPELRVRSTTSEAESARLHAAAAALLPILREELGTTHERRLQIAVLHERKTYGAYLDLAGLSAHKAAGGFADRVTGTAVLCSEGATDELVLGLALHELVHLCQLTAAPAAFPSWYLEGGAEAYGGQGTFAWDGKTLTTGGKMASLRLEELRAQPLPLRELLEADALVLLARDALAARRFYAQSWAFLRFLREGAGPEIAGRLERWREQCLGSVLGADLYKPYAMDPSASRALFLELFEADLARLEAEFVPWLRAL